MKNEEVLEIAKKRFDRAQSFERAQREEGSEDLRFLSGDQWPEAVRADRIAKDRPVLTFNRLPQFVQQVVGDARQNRPSIKVNPVDEQSDIETAEVFEGLIRNIEAESRATQAYITALEHSTGCGFGNWRILTEYSTDDSFEQDIRIKRITDPFAVSWDPGAREYDRSDANWCFVSEWMTKEDFEAKYPGKSPSDWEQTYKDVQLHQHWIQDDLVRVCEYWVKKPVTKKLGLTIDGQVVEAREGLTYERVRTVKTHKVCRYVLSGHEILEEEKEFPCKWIPIVPVFGPEEFKDGQLRPRSLIRYAKDPMRMYNFWQSTIAEKIALAPKSPWLVTPKMIEGLERFWNAANVENRAYLPYNPDPSAPSNGPKRQDPAHVNPAEIQQSAQAIDDLKATMGMYDASLGAQGNEQSGKAIIARQREGDTASYAWIDNLARSIQHTGRILIDMIPRIYDTERVVRVLGQDESVELVAINSFDEMGNLQYDLARGKYDVQITVGPSYATRRLEAADSMLQFIQAVPAAAAVTGDLIAKSMDWPGAEDIAERLKKMLPPGVADDEDGGPEQAIAQLSSQLQQAMEQVQMLSEELESRDETKERVEFEESQRKDAEARSKIETEEVEREGKELDNAQKAFELAMQSGQLQEIVAAQVQAALAQILEPQV